MGLGDLKFFIFALVELKLQQIYLSGVHWMHIIGGKTPTQDLFCKDLLPFIHRISDLFP